MSSKKNNVYLMKGNLKPDFNWVGIPYTRCDFGVLRVFLKTSLCKLRYSLIEGLLNCKKDTLDALVIGTSIGLRMTQKNL